MSTRSDERLLLVEDEVNLGSTLQERLLIDYATVDWAQSVEEAKLYTESKSYDLVLLDVGLPDGTGFEIAKILRKKHPETAIVFVTAHNEPEERLRGFELGAEDYVIKPFHLKELLIRISNLLKRSRRLTASTLTLKEPFQIGRAQIYFSKFRVDVGDPATTHTLSHKESALLQFLIERAGTPVTREQILDQIWTKDELPTPRTVDNFIVKLRKYIEPNPDDPSVIVSLRGVGYQLQNPLTPATQRSALKQSSRGNTLFMRAIRRENEGPPPIWFMRQAGRYHQHYQALRQRHSFIELCKTPEVACEVTMGPIRDFDFDAAILFSDLLFPLEVLGMGLTYQEGPQLDFHLKTLKDFDRLVSPDTPMSKLLSQLEFQADALRLIDKALPDSKGLIGFVGAPLTLFFYAAAGSHQKTVDGDLQNAIVGLEDGRFSLFCDRTLELVAQNMALQARAGAQTLALFDTCGGEITAAQFQKYNIPALGNLLSRFKELCPSTPVIYYSKGTDAAVWQLLRVLPFEVLGVDWRNPLGDVLKEFGNQFAVQGNFDPNFLLLSPPEFEPKLESYLAYAKVIPKHLRRGWVCGLGHGVLPKTPEENVRNFVKKARSQLA